MTFPEIADLYSELSPQNLSFEDFAQLGYDATEDPGFAEVIQSSPAKNRIRQANAWLNRGINSTQVDEWLGKGFGNLAELIGVNRATGERVGQAMPRAVIDMLPMLLSPLHRMPKLGMTVTGGLTALNTYGETGSEGRAAIAALTPYLGTKLAGFASDKVMNFAARTPWLQRLGFSGGLPASIRVAEDIAGNALPVGSQLVGRQLVSIPDKLLSYTAGQAAANAGFTGLDVLQEGPGILGSKDYWFSSLASNIPFLAYDLPSFRGRRWIGEPEVRPPESAQPIYTAAEVRAKNFREMMAGLNPAEQTAARRAIGLDIAESVLSERAAKSADELFNSRQATALGKLTSAWDEHRKLFPGTPELQSALQDRSVLKDYPDAQSMLEGYDMEVRMAKGEAEKAKRMVKWSDEKVMGVALDELKLPDVLLGKPVSERKLEDYETALGGVMSPEGLKRVWRRHVMDETGVDPAPEMGSLVESGRKKGVKERMEAVNAEKVAKGEKVLTDGEVKRKVEKEKKNGLPEKEAAEKVVAKEERKQDKKSRKGIGGAPKGPRQATTLLRGEIKQRIQTAYEVQKKGDEENFLLKADQLVSERSDADPVVMERMYSWLGKVWGMPMSPQERFKVFEKGLVQVKQREAMGGKTVSLEQIQETGKEPAVEEGVYQDEAAARGELAEEVVDVVEQVKNEEVDQDVKNRVAVQQKMVEMTKKLLGKPEMTDEAAMQKMAGLKEEGRRKLFNAAAKELGIKFAGDGMPFDGDPRKLVSLREYAQVILESQGFNPVEAKLLVPSFERMVEMFEAPDVKYGDFVEMPGMKFARTGAGGEFLFGMAEYNSQTRKLMREGGRDATVGRDGTLSLLEFKQAGGEQGPLKADEVELYKQLVPEAFVGDRVKVDVLWEGLKKAGNTVEVVTYGMAKENQPDNLRYAELSHIFVERLPFNDRMLISDRATGRQLTAEEEVRLNELRAQLGSWVDEFIQLGEKRLQSSNAPVATDYYKAISPFSTRLYPVERIDVTLPSESRTLWDPDMLHENLPNTLGWAMVQTVKHPQTGEPVLFIGELQSRWAQDLRNQKLRGGPVETPMFRDSAIAEHPLLEAHQNLILKSVIREAQKRGITKVALSDAETAMMTERHDRNLTPGKRPSQEKGMRLAYDTTLPSLMKSLVGEGKLETFGEHKNVETPIYAHEQVLDADFNIRDLRPGDVEFDFAGSKTPLAFDNPLIPDYTKTYGAPRILTEADFASGSPVFRTPAGFPRSEIGARVYDITSPSSRLSALFAREGRTTYAAALDRLGQIFFNRTALEKVGKSGLPSVFASLTAHENSHVLVRRAKDGVFGEEAKMKVEELEQWAKDATFEDVQDVVEVMSDVWLGKEMKELPGVGDVLRNLGKGKVDADEVMANLLGSYAAGVWRKGNRAETMTLLPKAVRNVFDWVAGKLQGMWDGMRTWARLGFDGKKVAQADKVKEIFDAVRRGARQAEKNIEEVARLGMLEPADVVKFARGEYGPETMNAKVEEFFDNWVMRGADFANTYPMFQKAWIAMSDLPAHVNDKIAQVLAPVYGRLDYTHGLKVDKPEWKMIRRSPSLGKLAQKINIYANQQGESMVEVLPDGKQRFVTEKLSPELRGELEQFSLEGQNALASLFVNREMMTKATQKVIVEKEREWNRHALQKVIQHTSGLEGRVDLAARIADGVVSAMERGDQPGLLQALAEVRDDAARVGVQQMAEKLTKSVNDLEQAYAQRPWFGSLRRFKPIKQYFVKGKEKVLRDFRTPEEARKGRDEMVEQGYEPERVLLDKAKDSKEFTMDPELVKLVRQKEQELRALVESLPIQEEARASILEGLDFASSIETAKAAQSVYSMAAKREFAPGAEHLDMLEQDLAYVNAAIKQSSMKALQAKISAELDQPIIREYPSAKDTFLQMWENFRNPTPEWARKMSKANAAWFLGFNLPGHFAELMQPVMTHLPELRAQGLGMLSSLKMISKAQKEIASFYRRALTDKVLRKKSEVNIWEYWKNPDEAAMLKELVPLINQGPLQSAFEEIGFSQQQVARIANGDKPATLGELIKSPASMAANIGLGLYSKFTQHNTISALLTGYRAARKRGLGHAEAVEQTKMFERVVNKTGGKAARQAAPFKGNGIAGHLFYALQGYTTGWLGQLATYYRHGYKGKDYPMLSQAERANARKAFRSMLTAQVGMAGMLGFPFFGAALSLMEEFLGEDLHGPLAEAVDEATGDPVIAQIATHGMASAMADAFDIPVDLHSRFSIGGFLGFNPYDGFSTKSLMGPIASMIGGLWNMGSKFAQEKDLAAALAAGGPTSVRNAAKVWAGDLGPQAGLAEVLGFRSAQQRQEQELKGISSRLEESSRRELALAAQRVRRALEVSPGFAQEKLRAEANNLLASKGLSGAAYREAFQSTLLGLAQRVSNLVAAEQVPFDTRALGSRMNQPRLSAAAVAMGWEPPEEEISRVRARASQLLGL